MWLTSLIIRVRMTICKGHLQIQDTTSSSVSWKCYFTRWRKILRDFCLLHCDNFIIQTPEQIPLGVLFPDCWNPITTSLMTAHFIFMGISPDFFHFNFILFTHNWMHHWWGWRPVSNLIEVKVLEKWTISFFLILPSLWYLCCFTKVSGFLLVCFFFHPFVWNN